MNPCAWCDRESGAVRPAGASHGICAMHAAIEVNAAKREQIESEIAECEERARSRFGKWRQDSKVARLLEIEWSEEPASKLAGGKRGDQVAFSAAVLVGSIWAGIIAGALACAARWAMGGAL